MLQEDQVTSTPSSRRVSISTAVCNKNHIKYYGKSVVLGEIRDFKVLHSNKNIESVDDLDGHVQTTSNPGALQRLWGAVLLPGENWVLDTGRIYSWNAQDRASREMNHMYICFKQPPDVHQARHLVLRHDQLLAAKVGQGDVGWCGKKSVRGRLIRGKKTGRCWLMWEKIRKWSADEGKGKIRRDFTIWKSSGKLYALLFTFLWSSLWFLSS